MWNPFKTKVVYAIPDSYTRWESRDVNPFERHKVIVKEVREGYVLCCSDNGVRFREFSCPLPSFHEHYLELPNKTEELK